MVAGPALCVICKGSRYLCGHRPCPLLARLRIKPKIERSLQKDFFGPATSIFIGHNFYPNVYVGPMAAIDAQKAQVVDSPADWFGLSYESIIELRSSILRSKVKQSVFSRTKIIEQNQELALAKRPTDVELTFKDRPTYQFSFSDITQPQGPSANLTKLKLAENPAISRKVDAIVADELKAVQAVEQLYHADLDVYKIITILSSGALGLEPSKKLVPTRWSFVAVYDMIAKNLMESIKQYPTLNKITVAESKYLDNHFIILMLPGNWEFENFETWTPGSTWYQGAGGSLKGLRPIILEEYEPFTGRTKYAELERGGYYASRLGCCEWLNKLRRQARVVVFREVSEGYVVPLGSWQILENIRNAFRQPLKEFDTLSEAFAHICPKLRVSIEEYVKQSRVLRQRRISDFLP